MNKLLILYPELFACQAKFDRKLTSITSRMTTFEVVHHDDPHGFIATFFADDERVTTVAEVETLEGAGITHAVVFDDGEEFEEQRDWLTAQAIPTRWIKVPLTRVVNIKSETEYQDKKSTPTYEYIGRGSYWGNPHSMYEEGDSRDEVIRKYKYDFDFNKFPNKEKLEVYKLTGKRLGCFCKPSSCHGDVLADYLNSYDDGK